ncbi:MAG: DUF4115 domain-containing protein [Alphaproteobacteria bacterium]|nr:DUF4115 domain-containing protein [Alphaproteobacteria bacterium]
MAEEIKDLKTNAEMTAGEILRDARTTGRRKREIPTIAKQLCIREEFLTALEDGDYTVLPETVYILGFARNYAMELGVDPDMIVEKIKKELGIAKSETSAPAPAPVEKPDVQKPGMQNENFSKKLNEIKDCKACKFVVKYWKWFVGGLILVVVLAGIAAMLIAPSGEDHTEAVATAQVVSNEPAYQQPVRERFGVENRDSGEIVLQSIQESWVKIEDARGKTVFSRVLVPGDVYFVPAGNKNKATFGNAGGIDVWVRGELVPKVGDDNTRKTGITLDADALLGTAKTE